MLNLEHFTPAEFVRCVPSCSIEQMDADFLRVLDASRTASGVPFILNSGFRSPEWDMAHKRTGRGYHTLGRAVDVKCLDGHTRAAIVRACLDFGLSCGIANTFIHIDNRPLQAVFLYK